MSSFLVLAIVLSLRASHALIRLPNTSLVDGQLTANLGVDHFFSLWIVFNNDDVVISDEPFTILAPRNTAIIKDNGVLQQPESVKRLLSDHVVLGARIQLNNNTANNDSSGSTVSPLPSPPPRTYVTLDGRNFTLTNKEGRWRANAANVLDTRPVAPNGLLVVLDDYLFPDDLRANTDKNNNNNKNDNHQEQQQQQQQSAKGQKQQHKEKEDKNIVLANKTSAALRSNSSNDQVGAMTVITIKEDAKRNATFIENVMQVLSLLKSGVRVFQHFLSRSNVSKLLNDEDEYTVFVPTDHAFQRWHPIDWGFYPFSVPEFTESVIINHFIKGKLKQDGIKTDQTAKTLGGKEVVFRKAPNLTVNGASIVKGDTPLPKGNIMFISEVLFVSESVVSRLHQQHRDKETPPLLAFPWFGAQFLSHAFLALERDRRFTHITRFLNLADLAPHVSGTGYTFFVPTDTAFEEIGLDKMPDNYLSTGDGLEILLNHFVKGRLYDRDLKDNLTLTSLGNKAITIGRRKENVTVNKAQIVESEVFVYNLGTMFYIDKVLFAKPELLPKIRRPLTTTTTTTTSTPSASTSTTTSTTTPATTPTTTGSTTSITETPTTQSPTTSTRSYATISDNDKHADKASESTTSSASASIRRRTIAVAEDVEVVPEELSETGGSMPDVLFADAEIDSNKEVQHADGGSAMETLKSVTNAATPAAQQTSTTIGSVAAV